MKALNKIGMVFLFLAVCSFSQVLLADEQPASVNSVKTVLLVTEKAALIPEYFDHIIAEFVKFTDVEVVKSGASTYDAVLRIESHGWRLTREYGPLGSSSSRGEKLALGAEIFGRISFEVPPGKLVMDEKFKGRFSPQASF